MNSLHRLLVLVILPVSLLALGGCAEAGNVSADITKRATEVTDGVGNVVREVKETRDAVIEKKHQFDTAQAEVGQALDSVNRFLGESKDTAAAE